MKKELIKMNRRNIKKKKQKEKYTIIALIIVFFSLFSLIEQGVFGVLFNHFSKILFGNMNYIFIIYLLYIAYNLYKYQNEFIKKIKNISILFLGFLFLYTYFIYELYQKQLVDFSQYFHEIINGNIYGVGIIFQAILTTIVYLFGNFSILLIGIFLLGYFFSTKIKFNNLKFPKKKKKEQKVINEKEYTKEESKEQKQEEKNDIFDDYLFDLEPQKKENKIKNNEFNVPKDELLNNYDSGIEKYNDLKKIAEKNSEILLETLKNYGFKVKLNDIIVGPAITKYELIPEIGTKVNKFNNLHNDLAFALAAKSVRIEAPIPGKSAIGIEIPNNEIVPVGLKEVLNSNKNNLDEKLQVPLGKQINGEPYFLKIDETPHLLIAGSTGSGKSICINSIIISLLLKSKPDEVKLVMIDPKKVELTPYNNIPNLLYPVVTEPKKAAIVLQKMVNEMEERYELFAQKNVRNIKSYNNISDEKLPYIVVIVDELADLMMIASNQVETSIARLAQMARAAGIHLIIATQRPSTDVITGLIKSNIPTRISFAVSSSIDSRTILDQTGAEQLLGKGDMLLSTQANNNLIRIQGAYISDDEITNIVNQVKENNEYYEIKDLNFEQELEILEHEEDPLYKEVERFVIKTQSASASMIQREFKVGYNRALRILDELEKNQIISENEGRKPRRVLKGDLDEN